MAISHVKSNPVADFTGTVTVFNSAGQTTTTLASALVRPSDWNSAHNQFLTISGNTAGVSTMSGTNIVLQGGANVTLSANGASLVFSAADPATQSVQTQNMVSVQGSTGAVSFANSNGITFGGNASTITASHNGITSQSVQTQSNVQGISAGTQVGRTGDIVFSNSNGISFGLSGSNTLTASYTVPSTVGLLSAINVSAGTTSNNLSALTMSNANGVSFGLNGSVLTASVAVAGGAQTGISGLANSETTYTSGSVSFSALGAITIRSTTGQHFQFSVNAQSVVPGIQSIAFANTTFTTGAVSFSNANGISFGSSGGQVTASYTVPTQTAFVLSNSNNVSFGTNGSTVTATATFAQTAQTQSNVQGIAVSDTTFRTGDVSFSNLNGISFGSNGANVVTISHGLQFTSATSAITSAALHTSASRVMNIVAATNSTGGGTASLSSNVSFSAANGVSSTPRPAARSSARCGRTTSPPRALRTTPLAWPPRRPMSPGQ